MNKLDQFIAYLLSWVNRAIYVWGGQGETITSTAQIYRMETSKVNALRAIALWVRRGRNAVCFDCSGLLVSWLLSSGLIKYDTTANGLLSRCWRINRGQLRRGDWVFRVKDGKAYHVGVIVDAELNVVESKGRDDGVVKRPLDATAGYWNVFGRPEMFKTEIENDGPKYSEPTATHPYRSRFTGNDAGWFETELHRIGYAWETMGCENDKPDEIAGSKVWDILDYEMDQSGCPRGSAGKSIREYLKALPNR